MTADLDHCQHGNPWWPPCARCCLPETMDGRGCADDAWVERIERFAEMTLVPLAEIEVRADIYTCQRLLANNKHARLAPERGGGVVIGMTTGDLLVRRDRNAANDEAGSVLVIVRGEIVSRIRTR